MSSGAPLEQRSKERQKERYPDEREDMEDMRPLVVSEVMGANQIFDFGVIMWEERRMAKEHEVKEEDVKCFQG